MTFSFSKSQELKIKYLLVVNRNNLTSRIWIKKLYEEENNTKNKTAFKV